MLRQDPQLLEKLRKHTHTYQIIPPPATDSREADVTCEKCIVVVMYGWVWFGNHWSVKKKFILRIDESLKSLFQAKNQLQYLKCENWRPFSIFLMQYVEYFWLFVGENQTFADVTLRCAILWWTSLFSLFAGLL